MAENYTLYPSRSLIILNPHLLINPLLNVVLICSLMNLIPRPLTPLIPSFLQPHEGNPFLLPVCNCVGIPTHLSCYLSLSFFIAYSLSLSRLTLFTLQLNLKTQAKGCTQIIPYHDLCPRLIQVTICSSTIVSHVKFASLIASLFI